MPIIGPKSSWLSTILVVATTALSFADPGKEIVVMEEFSRAVMELGKGLDHQDKSRLLAGARLLKKTVDVAGVTLKPQKAQNSLEQFAAYLSEIGRLAASAEGAIGAEDFSTTAELARAIRHTCTDCHLRFRRDNTDIFPARGNIVTGRVDIVEMNGKGRDDRSNAIVFLDRVPKGVTWSASTKRPIMSQKDRVFTPRVLPIVKSTTVDFLNDDLIFHNVFSRAKSQPFDLDVYPPGETRSLTFSEVGWTKVYCNLHAKMIAHIVVLNNPFFSLTDANGAFVIPDVPDGEYALRTWHEYGAGTLEEVEVSGEAVHYFELQLKEDKRLVKHLNKHGNPYKSKY